MITASINFPNICTAQCQLALSQDMKNSLTWIHCVVEFKYDKVPLKSDSHLPKNLGYLLDWKPFKNYEKCFLFRLKSFFRSQDIKVFVTTFWSCRKNSLIRTIKLTSKFMMSQPGLQTNNFNIHIAHYLTK